MSEDVVTPEPVEDDAVETAAEVDETAAADEAVADEAVADDSAAEESAADETAETDEAAAVAEFDALDGDDDTAEAPAPALPHLTSETAQTVGRRKEAVVRVRITPGSGKFLLNGKSLEDYFPNKVHQQLIREPLVVVEKPESFDIRANLHGGGITGQAGALRLAIARALIELDSEDRPVLKKAGFLTRDPRAKERKKYGLKKARKAPQYSKR
ncbi:30S ribosomal protein S9 [Actinokineospora diospyrosa]|uniref:Small ribosomal subunit protein uS9 n=1 Tax=Actinokineospora diospyrosa TaxID=103728 RepID=A0ABT1IIP3_9PSEU|nr:30S ribosomal protein S9 [Actinokineospora diospyrosa]MCP2272518.1 SSU ribosomal protein S9P [Actinokineospora diospyrosa]